MVGLYQFPQNILSYFLKYDKVKTKMLSMIKYKPKLSDDYIHEYRVSIGRSIRLLRERKSYSQDDLAEIMQVHRSTISKIETGKFAVSVDYLVKFGWYLDFAILLEPVEKKGSK